MLAVGVGYEYLAEIVASADFGYDAPHAVGVEFVEYVVEQKHRSDSSLSAEIVEYSEAERDRECLYLPLATEPTHGIVAEPRREIVAVNACRCEPEREVARAFGIEHFLKAALVEHAP